MSQPPPPTEDVTVSAAREEDANDGSPSAVLGTGGVSKVRIAVGSLFDIAIDLVLPTAAYLLLAPTHLPVAIRLTMGGFLVAGKATTGHTALGPSASGHDAPGEAADGRADRLASRNRLWASFGGAAAACAVTAILWLAGTGVTASIVAGTVVTAACAGLLLFSGRRQLDSFALLVLAELALSVIMSLVSADSRFILARPAVYTAAAGVYALATVRGKPFMMGVTRPFAAAGDPVRAEAFDRAWYESARFRVAERLMTALLGVVLLAEAALRVVTVYSQPEGAVLKASLLSQLPSVILFVAWFAIVRFVIVPVASKEVDALMK